MSNIQLQNSNLNGGLSNREVELQGSIFSQNTLQAGIISQSDLQATMTTLDALQGSMMSRSNIKGLVTKDVILKGIVVKPATIEVYNVDASLSLDSINPVQNKVITETLLLLYYALDEKADIGDIPMIPTNVSAFVNDAGYLTEHQDLSEYAKRSELPTIPTNVSAFLNDAGYLTEHQDLSEYAKTSDLPTKVSQLTNDAGYLTQHQDLSEYAKTADLPTKVSQFINDSGYLTEHQDLSAYAKIADLPTKVSQLVNDSGYLTQHQSLENYYTKSETTDKLNQKQDVLDKYVESVNGYSGAITLTAADIHALPDTTVIPTVPTIVSAFANDADYATRTYVTEVAAGKCQAYTFETVEELDQWLAIEENTTDLNNGDVFYIRAVGVPDYWWDKETHTKQILETTKVDLTDYAKASSIPTTVSQLINDANFITVAGVDTKLGNYQEKLTSYVSSVNGKTGAVSLTYTDVGAMSADTVIPTVPTKVSAFTNDAGYLTEHQSLAGYVTVATLNALAARVTALETALGGFIFVGATSAPTSAGANTITFVNAG